MIVYDNPGTPTFGRLRTLHVRSTAPTQRESTDFDHWQNWVRFDVHQSDLFEEGLVAVPSTWTFNHLM
jgi:hypothetical protein